MAKPTAPEIFFDGIDRAVTELGGVVVDDPAADLSQPPRYWLLDSRYGPLKLWGVYRCRDRTKIVKMQFLRPTPKEYGSHWPHGETECQWCGNWKAVDAGTSVLTQLRAFMPTPLTRFVERTGCVPRQVVYERCVPGLMHVVPRFGDWPADAVWEWFTQHVERRLVQHYDLSRYRELLNRGNPLPRGTASRLAGTIGMLFEEFVVDPRAYRQAHPLFSRWKEGQWRLVTSFSAPVAPVPIASPAAGSNPA